MRKYFRCRKKTSFFEELSFVLDSPSVFIIIYVFPTNTYKLNNGNGLTR